MKALTGKTCLITGATGFIGRHLVTRLAQIQGIHLILLSRHPHQPNADNITWIASSLNELSSETWRRAGISNIDIVFHLGAFTPRSANDADDTDSVTNDNIIGTQALLGSLTHGTCRIVFASTLDVYAPPEDGQVINEGSPLGPQTLYGASKLFCEKLVRAHCQQYHCGCAILRYGHIYGPGEEQYRKLIPELIRSLIAGAPLSLYAAPNTLRDFLYVEDAVIATLRAAKSTNPALGPINVASGQSVSIRQVTQLLAKSTGYRDSISFPSRPSATSFRFDTSLLTKELGTWERTPLSIGLANEVDYVRKLLQATPHEGRAQ